MAINEEELSKGLRVKLTALRKSLGEELADDVFAKWLKQHKSVSSEDKQDPVAEKIAAALAGLVNDETFRLGNQGYTVRRARGKGASGFIVSKNEK